VALWCRRYMGQLGSPLDLVGWINGIITISNWFLDVSRALPSGKQTVCELENGHRNSWLPINSMVMFNIFLYVCQRVYWNNGNETTWDYIYNHGMNNLTATTIYLLDIN
jgi:hypothetical protein